MTESYYVNIKTDKQRLFSNITFYPDDNTIGASNKIDAYGEKLGDLIDNFGREAVIHAESDDYYGDASIILYIDFRRPVTEEELAQIIPQVEKQKIVERKKQESLQKLQKKQKEKERIAAEKRKLLAAEREKKTYLRLKAKYERTIND